MYIGMPIIAKGRQLGFNWARATFGVWELSKRLGVDMPLLSAVIEINHRMVEMADKGAVAQATIAGPYREPSPALVKVSK